MSIFQDPELSGPTFQFTSLTPANREDIVYLSADLNLPGAAYVTANQLSLTALGATADLDGQWNYRPVKGDPAINLVSWRHISATGRDVYVRVVNKGYLFPLGHETVIVTIVERVVLRDPLSSAWADAYLQRQQYLRVLQPLKTYPAPGQPFGTNDWPFASVQLLTTVSPLLDPPNSDNPAYNPPLVPGAPPSAQLYQQAILPTSGGVPVQWSLVATDLAGNQLHLQTPLYFFAADDAGYVSEFDHTGTDPFVNAYNALTAHRQVDGHGAPLRLAPEAGGPAGGTTHPVVNLTLGAASPALDPNVPAADYPASPPSAATLQAAGQPAFYPVLSAVQLRLLAADALSRGSFSDSTGEGVGVQLYPGYVVHGLPETSTAAATALKPAVAEASTNPGAVYAQVADAVSSAGAPLLQFPSDAVGGLANPNAFIVGLSSIVGPVAGNPLDPSHALASLDNYANTAKAAVSDFFSTLTGQFTSSLSQLLGGLHLGDILSEFTDLLGGIPNLTATTDPTTGVLTVTYTLTANLGTWPSSAPVFVPQGSGGKLSLQAKATVATTGATTYDVKGSIDPFTVYLVGQGSAADIIAVPFNQLSFGAANGQKPSVQVSVGNVTFDGALSFVNTLEQFLHDLGGTGLSINVTPTEVDAGFSLSLPPVGCGVFSLSGISFSAGVELPFLGSPAVATFGFASQESPFLLTVCMFGGGGFLNLGLGFGGIQQIQAQFEFAGQFALDLGVASGGITLAAGVYYSYNASPAPGTTTLTGFVRLTGELSVLGLISISAELDLTLTYQSSGGQSYVEGTATLSVSISICFFSITVPITVHKQFAGGGGGSSNGVLEAPEIAAATPVTQVSFVDIVPSQSLWNTYVDAFGA